MLKLYFFEVGSGWTKYVAHGKKKCVATVVVEFVLIKAPYEKINLPKEEWEFNELKPNIEHAIWVQEAN